MECSVPMSAPRGGLTGNATLFVGDKGLMCAGPYGQSVWLLPNERWAAYELPPQLLNRGPEHHMDWIRACKGGDRACSDFSVSAPFTQWVMLGCIAGRFEGKLLWDGKNMRFMNNQAANEYVKPKFRKGWDLRL